jgi:hypothetical protein
VWKIRAVSHIPWEDDISGKMRGLQEDLRKR